jgi:2-dehydro-3-deoxyphosphogluconate aldolase / (4S)-4-hydroxy-2-oxoglutarate aldolase
MSIRFTEMGTPFSQELFQQLPIVGILRGLPATGLRSIVEAVRDGGLTNLEITMNTPGATDQIQVAREVANHALNIGAGTVTDLRQLEEALSAGASFIVTPTVVAPVIERCVQLKVPVFSGAFSPTEIVRAWELGATMVKVFPAEFLGPAYLRSLKAPFPHLKLMPTGGVDVATLDAYAKAGADAFGVGSPLFRVERIAAQDWEWLRNQSRAFAEAYRKTKQSLITAGSVS